MVPWREPGNWMPRQRGVGHCGAPPCAAVNGQGMASVEMLTPRGPPSPAVGSTSTESKAPRAKRQQQSAERAESKAPSGPRAKRRAHREPSGRPPRVGSGHLTAWRRCDTIPSIILATAKAPLGRTTASREAFLKNKIWAGRDSSSTRSWQREDAGSALHS